MIFYNNIRWINYQGALIPDIPPHINIELSKKEQQELLKLSKAYFLRWTNEWDREKVSQFWYVIKDEKEDINIYKSKIRNQIKKGLKNCKVEKVTKEYIAENGYEVYCEAFKRYETFLKPISRENFKKSVLNSKSNVDFWGVFVNNKLIAYSQNRVRDNVCEYNVTKFNPNFLKYRPSEALFYEMNKYYLNEKNFLYVSDGTRSLSHQTNIQDFLISKFKFRKVYCRLNIAYRKDIDLLVKILFPFRKIFFKSNNKYFQKLSVLLKHEEIRKSFDKN